MIALEHLSMQFGGDFLFKDVTITVRPGDRMGLVGPNGAGKSTLLRIIAGVYEPESGKVAFPNGFRIGYLPQEPTLDSAAQERHLLTEALRAKPELIAIEEELEEVQVKMETATDHESAEYHKVLDRFGELTHQFEDAGGFELKAQTQKILSGLGFTDKDLIRPVKEFSGGWQMRLMLAKLLISRPDGLLLDEPTNHLDLESLIWLEDFLKAYDGLIIIVSHDRTFLNAVTNRTAEIDQGKIEVFAGNYDFYEKFKAEREAQKEAIAANLAIKRKHLEDFVERFRYKATKARQAQSRVKMLERMERIELTTKGDSVHFSFPPAQQSGRMVFELEGLAKSYDGVHNIFSGVDLFIERGQRIAFLGKNGEGKTTMGKILAGEEPSTGGQVKIGHNVTIGYYAQHQAEALDPKLTVLETLEGIARAQFFHQGSGSASIYSQQQIRSLLGAFLFQGDDVFKPVRVLSGGEKSRLALAKMLLEPVNTLILDEPTNHLDMRSKEVVKEAILAFEGTVILISHDRDFLEDLAERVITFGKGKVKEYIHPLEQYLNDLHDSELARIQGKRKESREQKAVAVPIEAAVIPKKTESREEEKARKRKEAEERNARAQREKPLRNKISKVEADIARLEADIQSITDAMLDPEYYQDADRVKKDNERHAIAKQKLEQLYFDWGKLSEELEELAVS
jgi:ATP-binding cassette, subfamily F, member 3